MSSPAATKRQVLSAYRNLLHARSTVFRGDVNAYAKSLEEIRSQFRAHQFVREQAEIERMVQEANDAAEFLRTCIIQGSKAEEEEQFHLQMTEQQVSAHLDKTVNINPITEDFVKREERRANKALENQKAKQQQP